MPAEISRTKTVATVGPACNTPQMLFDLIDNGVNVFRVNMAHGSRDEHNEVVANIRAASEKAHRPVGILVDLAGPKIRLGQLAEDPTDCRIDAEFIFCRGEVSDRPNQLVSNYERLVDELSAGDLVMLADGTVSMRVIESTADEARCRVTSAGLIRSRQGINLPGVKLSVPAMTEEDLDNAVWAARSGIDFVSLSFVRTPVEIQQLKQILADHRSVALVIAKIEKGEALAQLDEIVTAADGVMVARGDLGVEIDVAEMPVAQKRIIATCQRLRKPVIVATQMLESMHHSRRPTRAETTDVANAILDGADACMLSGETAIGEFPREAVAMMQRIMLATETMLRDTPGTWHEAAGDVHPITSAVVFGSGQIAEKLDAKLVVIATRSGATARIKAKQRDFIPTIGVSSFASTLRQMCLFWGIMPLQGAPVEPPAALRQFIYNWGRENGRLQTADRVVFVTGTGMVKGAHNLIVVYEVE